MTTANVVRPLLKYPGGKRKVAFPLLREIGGDRKALVDLCCGAGAYLHAAVCLGYKEIHAADASPLIQEWWRRSMGPHWVFHRKDLLQRDLDFTEREYYELRDKVPDLMPADIYALNRGGYNGLARFSKSGKYNTPWGQVTQLPKPDEFVVDVHFAVAQKITNFETDYRRALLELPRRAAVFVLDPPYLGGFVGYTPEGWRATDLMDALHSVKKASKTGDVILIHEHTGGEAQHIIEAFGGELYGTWNRSGTINSNPNDRGPRQEGVWIIEGGTP